MQATYCPENGDSQKFGQILSRSADLGKPYLADEEVGTRKCFPHPLPDGIEYPRGDLILFVKYKWRGRSNLKRSA